MATLKKNPAHGSRHGGVERSANRNKSNGANYTPPAAALAVPREAQAMAGGRA